MASSTPSPLKLLILANKLAKETGVTLAEAMEKLRNPPTEIQAAVTQVCASPAQEHAGIDRYGNALAWNDQQWAFIQLVVSCKSAVLIGAAGTGKTTTMRGALEQYRQSVFVPSVSSDHKYLPNGSPGIVACSYTRRAVMNLRRSMPDDLKGNCLTIHKLLEYGPVFYEVVDPTTGEAKNTMRFEPRRGAWNPLPSSIKLLIIDESAMVSLSLYAQLRQALPENCQILFLGDIQQLPPIFGSAILGYKLNTLPVVELTVVYRQALESPIIRLAHRILSGVPIPLEEFGDWDFPGQLKLHPWKKKISADNALHTLSAFFRSAYDSQQYDPEEDQILIPFNEACGTIELNRYIASHIAKTHGREVWEVIAGFNSHYFSIGDKILYEKEDATITGFRRNSTYFGKFPRRQSIHMDYWGSISNEATAHHLSGESAEDIDTMLEGFSLETEDAESRVRAASHIIVIRLDDSGDEVEVSSAAEVNSLLLSYALTVHKSQGSEWRKVFLCLHQSHNTMLQRELLYTACTRPREQLYVICEPDSFVRGIKGQRIKGQTIAEKAEFFKGKVCNEEAHLIPFTTY